MNKIYANAMGLLENNNQNHILDYMDKVDNNSQEKLIEQITSLDFRAIK